MEGMEYRELKDVGGRGVEVIPAFAKPAELGNVLEEIGDPNRVQWLDAHEIYENQRGLRIEQNHFTFALKLSAGDQSFLDCLPATKALLSRTQNFIRSLAPIFPPLRDWQADELSFHLYDNKDVGLSRHRDNLRFIGLVAIVAIENECDLVVRHQNEDVALPVAPGDLCLLRAPGLIEAQTEIRPEHSVQNLRSETRTSMMIRANNRPAEPLPGFKFNNWHNKED